ncbi:MAG: radical SAM protein [Spirochaetaceae bacterium]|jgi:MoaA/NifB/PqqE/SkfB family radical SAM enzyme|nr:radical SAM protein [Spirochaetaceae bacterium]
MAVKKGILCSLIDTLGHLRIILSKIKRNLSLYKIKVDSFNEVFVEITSRCNFHCEFCPSDSLLRKKEDIKDEYMLKILSELRDKNKVIAFHVLGEPLLNKNFFKYLSLCDEYNIEAHLTTNMSLLTEEVFEKTLEHKCVTLIMLSLQTYNERSFKLRGSSMPFEEYFALLEKIVFNEKRIRSNCKINISVMNDYHCHNDELWRLFYPEEFWKFMNTIEKWKDKLFSQGSPEKSRMKSCGGNFYYGRLDDIPKDFYNRADEIHYEITPNLAVLVKHVGKFGMPDSFVNFLNNRENCQYKIKNIPQLFPFPCWSVQTPCVLSNGEITCCCVDIEGALSLGNIEIVSLEEAAKSKKRSIAMKHPILFETCRKCKGRLAFQKIKK